MRHSHIRRIRFETLEDRYMMAVLVGDYDLNGTVQPNDYTVWKSNFGDQGISVAGDGNGDGIVDAADYTVWRDNLGKTFADVPPDPPKTIAVFPTGATTADATWAASAFATSYTVQRRQPSVSSEFSDVGTNVMATSFSDSGLTEGEVYEYQVLARNDGGSSVPSQLAAFQAGRGNLTAFRPQQFYDPENPTNGPIYEPFAKHEVAEGVEESTTLGAGIRINNDDDNMSGVADRFESGVAIPLENDLIEVRVDRLPGQNLVLSNDGNLAFFYDYDKSTPIPLQNATTTVPLTFTGNSGTVFVEWFDADHGFDRLFLRNAANMAIVDGVRFHTFHTAVVAFGGDTQVPADPVLDPKNYGVFRTAIDLYNEGFDVRMYNEDDLDLAYAEIVNSIEFQGYDINDDPLDGLNGVALFGYSHGGGAVYEISAMLEADSPPFGDITKLFAVSFTSYIDAVEHGGGNEETRRPLLSKYHLNQYQRFGFPRGAAMADLEDPDDEENRTAPGMTHTRIDDDLAVLNLLKQRLRQKVIR